jgi:hypothetical protein
LKPPVLARMQELGHKVFTGDHFDLNLFGIRHKTRTAGVFDDLIGCAWREDRSWHVRYWPATTDPGVDKNAALATKNPKGAAVLAPGQYLGVWEIGPHGKSQYKALIQTGAPVRVFRPGAGATFLDLDDSTLETGYFGINCHASSMRPYDDDRSREHVGVWSEGCQTHATNSGFRSMMNLAINQTLAHPTWQKFSYTLLDQWW